MSSQQKTEPAHALVLCTRGNSGEEGIKLSLFKTYFLLHPFSVLSNNSNLHPRISTCSEQQEAEQAFRISTEL